jgi:predicted GIY-YIG superfamily endonuclease
MRKIRGPLWDGGRYSLTGVPSKDDLEKRLRSCYDKSRDTRISLSQAEYSGCVYVLECAKASAGRAESLSLHNHNKQQVPWWVDPSMSAPQRLYVGRAKDLTDRLWDHIRGSQHGGAHYTSIFPPRRLRRVFLYSTYTHRDQIEGKVTQTIDRENEDAFVYSDRYDTLRGYKDYGEDSSGQRAV